jgi:hypothetical protein
MPKKKTPPAPPKRPLRSLLIADLHTTYADAVRAGDRDPFHVARIRKAYEAGERVDPVIVTTWPGGAYYLADGGYRRLAKLELKCARIPAEIVACENEEDAQKQALVIAAQSNEPLVAAKPRSEEDVRATIAAILKVEWAARESDRGVSDLVSPGRSIRHIVREVRMRLSASGVILPESYAHADHPTRRYKEQCKIRGGHVQLKDGTTVLAGSEAATGRATNAEASARASEPDPGGRPDVPARVVTDNDEPFDYDAPPPAPVAPAAPVTDGKGRLVPVALAHHFTPDSPAYVVCPHVDEAGNHRQCENPKQCLACRGRFYLTRDEHDRLPDDLRNVCAGREPELDQRGDDRRRSLLVTLDRFNNSRAALAKVRKELALIVGQLKQATFDDNAGCGFAAEVKRLALEAGVSIHSGYADHMIDPDRSVHRWSWDDARELEAKLDATARFFDAVVEAIDRELRGVQSAA